MARPGHHSPGLWMNRTGIVVSPAPSTSMEETFELARARRTAADRAARDLAETQAGLLARRQLTSLGIDANRVRNQIAAGRWCGRSSTVVSTTTGPLSREQAMWLGVLHAGSPALVGGLTAAERLGLRNWHRDEVTVLVPYENDVDHIPGIHFVRTRRGLGRLRAGEEGLPLCRLEPAVLLFAAYQRSRRTAQGVVAAAIQQQLTTVEDLERWLSDLRPIRFAPVLRAALADIAGGAQSVAEIDVRRMCRTVGLALPQRQRSRRDVRGKHRWTDCEWEMPDGHVLVLEVDGGFHMEAEHWEGDLARQRRISHRDRTIVRCTARELRDEPGQVARDLLALGVPRDAQDAG